MKKKRAPIQQLRKAGEEARALLIKKGLRAEESVIDKIVADENAPTLPGLIPYLPHVWTLKATQQVLRDIVIMWMEKCAGDEEKSENIHLFWLFVRACMKEQENAYRTEYETMSGLLKRMKDVPILKDIFSPVRKLENTEAIHRFLVDSFAVAIVVKQQDTTSEYLNWFLDWTQDLTLLWVPPNKRKKFKRV